MRTGFVYLILRGGLGNQLFCLTKGILEAHERSATLIVDGSGRYTDRSRRCWLRHMDLVTPLRTLLWAPPSALDSVWISTGMSVPRVLSRRWLALRGWHGPISEISGTVCVIDGHFEKGTDAARARTLGLMSDLSLISPSKDHVRRISRIDTDDIAVHVRLGDFRGFGGGRLLLGAAYYRGALRNLGDARSRIRVFSDEPDLASKLLVEEVGVNPSTLLLHSALTPPEELDYFRRHKRMVISNSTFSWWGAFSASLPARERDCDVPVQVAAPAEHSCGLEASWLPVG